ncbi:hypothetical protein CSHISOI_03207 [Colletotrichum shisoi]|uniref:Uncharacterized protein n=1 Tax=Colletotrichum shisoi TaxID=2078593 RepID=A0A5Q4BYU1_9PEZI|nr:hypothetical protein CSHISOI_03207 [Colletotrichum shisoi]
MLGRLRRTGSRFWIPERCPRLIHRDNGHTSGIMRLLTSLTFGLFTLLTLPVFLVAAQNVNNITDAVAQLPTCAVSSTLLVMLTLSLKLFLQLFRLHVSCRQSKVHRVS